MNAWDDTAFRAAVEKAGKKRLIGGALYAEIYLAFPVVDAMRDGYDSMFVIGGVPNTSLALVTELSYDWKSALADPAREIIKWYQPEARKLAAAKRVIKIAEQVPAPSPGG